MRGRCQQEVEGVQRPQGAGQRYFGTAFGAAPRAPMVFEGTRRLLWEANVGSVAGFYRTAGCRPRLRDLKKKKGYAKGVLTNMEDGEAFRDEGYAGAWCGAAACTFFWQCYTGTPAGPPHSLPLPLAVAVARQPDDVSATQYCHWHSGSATGSGCH